MKKEIVLFATYILLCVVIVSSCEKESKSAVKPATDDVTEVKPPPVVTVGQEYGGGIVFYVDATGRHGLIVSKVSQSEGMEWSNGTGNVLTDATGTTLGWGKENTISIVNAQGQGMYAAWVCKNLNIKGYDDWFLPSKEELHLLYNQKISGKLNNLNGLSNNFYWSSTETSENGAWSQSFSNGANSSADKQGTYAVRAIRAF